MQSSETIHSISKMKMTRKQKGLEEEEDIDWEDEEWDVNLPLKKILWLSVLLLILSSSPQLGMT